MWVLDNENFLHGLLYTGCSVLTTIRFDCTKCQYKGNTETLNIHHIIITPITGVTDMFVIPHVLVVTVISSVFNSQMAVLCNIGGTQASKLPLFIP